MGTVHHPPTLALLAVTGPRSVRFELAPPGPLMLGRRAGHPLELSGDDRVSRDHARFVHDPATGGWRVEDAGSKHGTSLNGARLTAGAARPIKPGDVITITPWTFRVVTPGEESSGVRQVRRVATYDDASTHGTIVTGLPAAADQRLAAHRLSLLLECAGSIHGATDETALAERVLDAAVAGAGFSNVAVLRPADGGEVEIVAARGDVASGPMPQLSRSLIEHASRGEPAQLQARGGGEQAQSVIDLRIQEAICAPIMLAGDVAGFLYLDNRGSSGARGLRPAGDAAGFAVGLARLAGLALAHLRRLDLEREYARLDAEIAAAAEAQRWIAPARSGSFGRLSYIGESRAGRRVGGDFFDVIPLGEERIAVALGDVSGKGAAAAVLMTASQGFLHAALRNHGDPGRAVTDLNAFMHPRRPGHRFLTLWVGVFDGRAGTLRYVDAGHGMGFMVEKSGMSRRLTSDSGLVGIEPDTAFEAATCALEVGGRVAIVSDGLVEQTSARGDAQFGVEGVARCLRESRGDEVEALFDAVEAHAGTNALADDATAVVVRWG